MAEPRPERGSVTAEWSQGDKKPSMAETPSPTKAGRAPSAFSQQQSRVSKASSRRGTSTLRSQLSQPPRPPQPGSNWGRVRSAVKKGALVAVGLKQTGPEKLHWNAIQRNVQASTTPSVSSASSPWGSQPRPGLQRLRSRLSYHDVPAAHIAYPSYTRQMSSLSAATRRGVSVTGEPGRSGSAPGVIQTDGGTVIPPAPLSLYGTGRVQAVRQELKPDLWKIAYQGVRRLVSQSEAVRERWPLL
jgi:hypothetical protein